MLKYNLIFIFGGPASGKGTLCSKLVKRMDHFVHVSPGDLIREKQDLNLVMSNLMKGGKLLPTPFIGNLIWSHIKQNFGTDKIILVDGFPRNKENLEYYNTLMKDNFNLLATILLDCEDTVMVERTMGRAKLLGRTDDTEKVCKKRIQMYRDETDKVVQLLDPQLVKKVYSGGPEENTYAQTFKILLDVVPF